MHNPKMDCTVNIVTVTFLLQHLFNDDEEIYDPPMDVSTVLGVTGSSGRWEEGKYLPPPNFLISKNKIIF